MIISSDPSSILVSRSRSVKSFFLSLGQGILIGLVVYCAYHLIVGRLGSFTSGERAHTAQDVSLVMATKARLLCLVDTTPEHHAKRAKAVKATWGKRCDILIFISSKDDVSLPAVALDGLDGSNSPWGKTKRGFKYAYQYFYEKADWFLRADDENFVIVENLRHMLHAYNPSEPFYFGCLARDQDSMKGGAGYVVSIEALRRFAKEALTNSTICRRDDGGEKDEEFGRCLEGVGVPALDARDSLGRQRFLPFNPANHLPEFDSSKSLSYSDSQSKDCCSDSAISFHQIDESFMYVLEYMVYHLKPYGVIYNAEDTIQMSK